MSEPPATEKGWLIAGHYGGQNTGDDAMLVGVLNSIPSELLSASAIVSRSDLLPESPCRRVEMKATEVLSALKASRGLIIGGGTHFQDEFSGGRAVRHFRYMMRYVLLSMWARMRGKTVLWLGLGFGPIDRASTRWLVRLGSRFCSAITARDQASFDILQACKPRCPVHHAFDLCPLALDLDREPPGPVERVVLGICPVYCSNTSMSSIDQDQAFWLQVVDAVAAGYEGAEITVKIFKFRSGEREADNEVCELFLNRLSAIDAERVSLVTYRPDPGAMYEEITSCSHFISARFHGAMMSWLAGCRMLFVPYHRKVSDLADEIGLAPTAQWRLDQRHTDEQLAQDLKAFLSGDERFVPTGDREAVLARSDINLMLIREASAS